MAYQLNEKLKNMVPYEPISGNYAIRLDANESFLPLDREILIRLRRRYAVSLRIITASVQTMSRRETARMN